MYMYIHSCTFTVVPADTAKYQVSYEDTIFHCFNSMWIRVAPQDSCRYCYDLDKIVIIYPSDSIYVQTQLNQVSVKHTTVI